MKGKIKASPLKQAKKKSDPRDHQQSDMIGLPPEAVKEQARHMKMLSSGPQYPGSDQEARDNRSKMKADKLWAEESAKYNKKHGSPMKMIMPSLRKY
jgi:hypothetical protein